MAVLVIRQLTPRHEESWPLFSIYVVVLGTLSYVMLASIQALVSALFSMSFGGELRFFSYLAGTSRQVDPIEVLWSSVFAVFLSLGLTLLINKESLHRRSRKKQRTDLRKGGVNEAPVSPRPPRKTPPSQKK